MLHIMCTIIRSDIWVSVDESKLQHDIFFPALFEPCEIHNLRVLEICGLSEGVAGF